MVDVLESTVTAVVEDVVIDVFAAGYRCCRLLCLVCDDSTVSPAIRHLINLLHSSQWQLTIVYYETALSQM